MTNVTNSELYFKWLWWVSCEGQGSAACSTVVGMWLASSGRQRIQDLGPLAQTLDSSEVSFSLRTAPEKQALEKVLCAIGYRSGGAFTWSPTSGCRHRLADGRKEAKTEREKDPEWHKVKPQAGGSGCRDKQNQCTPLLLLHPMALHPPQSLL